MSSASQVLKGPGFSTLSQYDQEIISAFEPMRIPLVGRERDPCLSQRPFPVTNLEKIGLGSFFDHSC
jgi:hypothetical protein